ncbi:AAA family ATPase [Candidatus Woesearchaeota archaeon]|nr:AAA family ATPase [Candidatus Woesearchaeota archaeon]
MLIHSLKLQNIRSYSEQTIHFPRGSTILSGDIGSGKSTLLQALEFALFGVSRPDLPAEALLRKGATHALVELNFSLGTNQITIQRKLKKEKEGIKQLPGSIIINNLKKELMPIELKAEMIALLGYPEEFLTKNKNYIFRYTVYCPQEEMKLILQEDAETRLDTLRKIFGLDKYKIIRENIQIYLKELRIRKMILEERTTLLPEKEKNLQTIQEEIYHFYQQLQELIHKKTSIQQELSQQQQQLQQYEQQQQQRQQLLHQLQTVEALLQEKQKQLQQMQEKMQQLLLEIQQFISPALLTKQELAMHIYRTEYEKKDFLTKKAGMQEKQTFFVL